MFNELFNCDKNNLFFIINNLIIKLIINYDNYY